MPDPLFGKVWEVYAARWSDGILDINKDAAEIIAGLLQQVFESDMWWGMALGKCCAAHWVYEKDVPEKYWGFTTKLNRKLVREIQKIDPGIQYIRINYDTLVQGGNTHIPSIKVEISRRWFGYDSSEAKTPPNWGTHRASARIDIAHNALNYQGYQQSKPDAKPKPKFPDFFPDYEQWGKACFFNIHHSKKYIIFPGDETDIR